MKPILLILMIILFTVPIYATTLVTSDAWSYIPTSSAYAYGVACEVTSPIKVTEIKMESSGTCDSCGILIYDSGVLVARGTASSGVCTIDAVLVPGQKYRFIENYDGDTCNGGDNDNSPGFNITDSALNCFAGTYDPSAPWTGFSDSTSYVWAIESITYQDSTIEDGITHRYPFMSNVTDVVGSDDWTPTDITYGEQGALFNGASSKGTGSFTNWLPSGTADWTMCLQTNQTSLGYVGITGVGTTNFLFWGAAGYKEPEFHSSAGSVTPGTYSLNASTDYSICYIRNATSVNIYEKTSLLYGGAVSSLAAFSGTFYLGNYAGTTWWDGWMKEMCTWDRKLSNAELEYYSLYGCSVYVPPPSGGSGLYQDLQGWCPESTWTLNNITITTNLTSTGDILFRHNATNSSVSTSSWYNLTNGTSTIDLNYQADDCIYYEFYLEEASETISSYVTNYTIWSKNEVEPVAETTSSVVTVLNIIREGDDD